MAAPLRFGIVGTGRMADRMLRTLRARADIEVIAAGSSMPDRARAFAAARGLHAAGSAEDLIARSDLDAVYIASRNGDHARLSLAALGSGKAVLCEKPAAISGEQARHLAAGARASGRPFMEAIATPFLPAFARAVALCRGGAMGRATQLRADFGFPATADSHPALYDARGGGVLLDRLVYPLILSLHVLGPVTRVRACLTRDQDGVDVEASLLLDHEEGGCAQIAVSFLSRTANAATIGCEAGSVTLAAPITAPERILRVPARRAAHRSDHWGSPGLRERLKGMPLLRRLAAHGLTRGETHSYGADPYAPELAHFVSLLREGRRESPVVPLETTLAVQAVIDAARHDAASRP